MPDSGDYPSGAAIRQCLSHSGSAWCEGAISLDKYVVSEDSHLGSSGFSLSSSKSTSCSVTHA